MRKVIDVFIAVFITFIANMVINGTTNYFFESRGDIESGQIISINSEYYLPINITNYKTSELNNVILSAPKYVDFKKIASSQLIKISASPNLVGPDQIQYLTFSGIRAMSNMQILIPLNSAEDDAKIKPINFMDIGLEPKEFKTPKGHFWRALKEIFWFSFIGSIFAGILTFYFERRRDELLKNNYDLKKNLEDLVIKQKEVEEEINRINLFYKFQLSDYAKELDFWRDTVRKLVWQGKDKKEDFNKLILDITEALKTYSIRENVTENFETINTLARMLAKGNGGAKA